MTNERSQTAQSNETAQSQYRMNTVHRRSNFIEVHPIKAILKLEHNNGSNHRYNQCIYTTRDWSAARLQKLERCWALFINDHRSFRYYLGRRRFLCSWSARLFRYSFTRWLIRGEGHVLNQMNLLLETSNSRENRNIITMVTVAVTVEPVSWSITLTLAFTSAP